MRVFTPLVALLASHAVLAGCGVHDPYQGATATSPTRPTATTPASTPPAAASPDGDETHPSLSPAQRDAERRARRAARTFLSGYLRYSYAQATGAAIRAVTPALRRELARHPPRVSRELVQSARPRVTSLRATGVRRDRVYLLAQITDGHTSYATTLTATRHDGTRWLVSEVQ